VSAHLIACPGCARHVRVSDAACPFCQSALDEGLRARPAPLAPAVRLSRAALFAFGTGTAALTGACSDSSSGPVIQPAYGGTFPHDAEAATSSSSGSEHTVTPAYGFSGLPYSEASSESSSTQLSVGSVQPAYGASAIPFDGGASRGPADAAEDAPATHTGG